MHIAIAGNIGAGKTTLTKKLASHYGWEAFIETVETNPYLKDFYEDMPRWSFHLQVFFLSSRFKQVVQIYNNPRNLIQDRSIYEDAYIFANNLYVSGLMAPREYKNYLQLFESMIQLVQPPHLLVYLRADLPKLLQQIGKRGRDYEANISVEYLQSLNQHYENWISGYTAGELLIIDVNNLDFVNNPGDMSFIISQVDQAIRTIPA
ncbi:deoxynucleoside kinase [Rhodocytophaga aerolata]|uniref:Deoxynucleoside kinase n=1 Tax=Rhodocytophaga aerolata TaxID=455078 RepID=A0ABT8R3Z7_9BACT|nr:deoxynucleoside kinase [Rhodocytophaga aerolata]MDO1446003.1 deoxynucleoside kinase [Rhodocytophaga aerolata]